MSPKMQNGMQSPQIERVFSEGWDKLLNIFRLGYFISRAHDKVIFNKYV